jgi:hypothetical protein
MAKVIVSIPDKDDRRFRAWRKLLTHVDREQKGGYAFEGSWLQAGRKEELETGSFVLLYDESGSMKHHYARVWLAVVDASGELVPVEDGKGPIRSSGADWALNIRDRVAAALAARDTAREGTDDTAGYCPFCGSSQCEVEKHDSEDGEKVKCLDCGRMALIIVEHEG